MTSFAWFAAGAFLGGLAGIVLMGMCCAASKASEAEREMMRSWSEPEWEQRWTRSPADFKGKDYD